MSCFIARMNYEVTIDSAVSPKVQKETTKQSQQNKKTLTQFSFENYWVKIFVVYKEKCCFSPALSYE